MIDLIYSIQQILSNEGTNINTMLALVLALITLIITAYLVESEK